VCAHVLAVAQIAQSTKVTFELHTLGWEAFQNLCGHIVREILGQTVTVFSSSRDAGQDGAFQGEWRRQGKEAFAGRFVIQCKFTARRDANLTMADLKDELQKASKLAGNSLSQTYLLITNANISGESDTVIRDAFGKVPGIRFFDLFGCEWITQQILASKRLRAFVPRIYGLGDLSQILDERVYRQADEILQSWKDNLAKFVPTDAHHRSVTALIDQGFVLLLGDPMAGKSTIAAALALAAADQWNCAPVFVRNADEFQLHWNPDEPQQMFWVDDAFGQIQFEPFLAAGWNRVFPHLFAAIRKGARVLFTSRTYVYRGALRDLKSSAFPLLKSSQVIIEVEKLTLSEKERILYNHLRLGQQPANFRRSLKSFLPEIAANAKFFPEIAKRLSDPFFTRGLNVDPESLRRFVEEPKDLLMEIISQQDRANFAALALLFMRAGRVSIPPRIESYEAEAMQLLGVDLAQLCDGLNALNGSLVSEFIERGERYWSFRHPTVRDATAAHVALRPQLLDIYLGGAKVTELLREVVCGDVEIEGAKVQVPSSRFEKVIAKLRALDMTDWNLRYNLVWFLAYKCSDEFLVGWIRECDQQLSALLKHMSVTNHSFAYLLSRLHGLGHLAEDYRSQYVSEVVKAAVDSAETTFLEDDLRNLLKPADLEMILNRVKEELAPNAEWNVEQLEQAYDDPEYDVDDYFADFRCGFETFRDLFDDADTVRGFENGLTTIDQATKRLNRRNEERHLEEASDEAEMEGRMRAAMDLSADITQNRSVVELSHASVDVCAPRSIFDDVDA
jgi:hypothetical protein